MSLFEYLSSDNLPHILQAQCSHRSLKAGNYLFRQGESSRSVYTVKSGRLHLLRHMVDGKLLTVRVVRAGESCVESGLFSEVNSFSAIAEVDAEVNIYPKAALLIAFERETSCARAVLYELLNTNHHLQEMLELRSIRSARERILTYLRFVASSQTREIVFDRPLKDVANEIGLSPEAFYRTLAQLEQDGIISRRDSHIQLRQK